MGIDNGFEVDISSIYLRFQHWGNPGTLSEDVIPQEARRGTYSGGLAGSMITESFDVSSVTR